MNIEDKRILEEHLDLIEKEIILETRLYEKCLECNDFSTMCLVKKSIHCCEQCIDIIEEYFANENTSQFWCKFMVLRKLQNEITNSL